MEKKLSLFFVIFIICSGSKPVKTTKESSVNVSRINFNKLTVSKCSLSVIVLLAQNQHGCEKSCLASLNQYANVLIYGQSDSSWMMRDPTLSIYPILTVFVFFSLFFAVGRELSVKNNFSQAGTGKKNNFYQDVFRAAPWNLDSAAILKCLTDMLFLIHWRISMIGDEAEVNPVYLQHQYICVSSLCSAPSGPREMLLITALRAFLHTLSSALFHAVN